MTADYEVASDALLNEKRGKLTRNEHDVVAGDAFRRRCEKDGLVPAGPMRYRLESVNGGYVHVTTMALEKRDAK